MVKNKIKIKEEKCDIHHIFTTISMQILNGKICCENTIDVTFV